MKLTATLSTKVQDSTWSAQQWVADHEKHLNRLTTAITLAVGITLVSTAYTYQQKAGTMPEHSQTITNYNTIEYIPQTCAEAEDMITKNTLPVHFLQTEISAAKTLCAPSRYEKIVAYKQLQEAAK